MRSPDEGGDGPEPADHPLMAHLDCAVPLLIAGMRAAGGPSEAEWVRGHQFARRLSADGDVLLFSGPDAAELAGEAALFVALLAFSLGGVRLFGRHWEAGE